MLGQIIDFDKEATLRVRQHRRDRVQERMQLVQKSKVYTCEISASDSHLVLKNTKRIKCSPKKGLNVKGKVMIDIYR